MRRALIGFLALALTLPLTAAELARVEMADSVEAGGKSLVLNGLGLRKKAIFKVYVGGLYLEAKESDAAKVLAGDGAWRVVMHFTYKKVRKDQLCEGWDEGLAGNTPAAPASVKQGFETLCGYMEDVVKGERVVFTYLPGTGTEVEVKGAAKGTLAGEDLADALLAVWLGPKPPTADLKSGMLGH